LGRLASDRRHPVPPAGTRTAVLASLLSAPTPRQLGGGRSAKPLAALRLGGGGGWSSASGSPSKASLPATPLRRSSSAVPLAPPRLDVVYSSINVRALPCCPICNLAAPAPCTIALCHAPSGGGPPRLCPPVLLWRTAARRCPEAQHAAQGPPLARPPAAATPPAGFSAPRPPGRVRVATGPWRAPGGGRLCA
jgi:hypothetical protein